MDRLKLASEPTAERRRDPAWRRAVGFDSLVLRKPGEEPKKAWRSPLVYEHRKRRAGRRGRFAIERIA
jgi:hypothetical protein